MIAHQPSVVNDRAQWLDWRRDGIGASETAALLDLDPFKTKLDIWLDKVEPTKQDRSPSEAAEIGLLVEPVIAELYKRRTGRRLESQQIQAKWNDDPIVRATLDGIDSEGEVVEFKSVGYPHSEHLGDPGTDEVPLWWIVQVQQQMLVAEASVANIAVLLHGREFLQYRVEANASLQERLVETVRDFWDHHVTPRVAPDAVMPADARHLAKLFRSEDGSVELDESFLSLADEFLEVSESKTAAEKRREGLKATILHAIGNHKFGVLPDGRMFRRNLVHVKERVQTVAAHTQVRLSLVTPKEKA